MSDLVFAGESHEFFAPTQFDLIDSLISQYNGVKERINTIAGMVTGEALPVALKMPPSRMG